MKRKDSKLIARGEAKADHFLADKAARDARRLLVHDLPGDGAVVEAASHIILSSHRGQSDTRVIDSVGMTPCE